MAALEEGVVKVNMRDLLQACPKSAFPCCRCSDSWKIKSYKTIWTMGHKIRKAMADRDASNQLAGLLEMDDAFFGPSKPGKRGRGAVGKAKVVVVFD